MPILKRPSRILSPFWRLVRYLAPQNNFMSGYTSVLQTWKFAEMALIEAFSPSRRRRLDCWLFCCTSFPEKKLIGSGPWYIQKKARGATFCKKRFDFGSLGEGQKFSISARPNSLKCSFFGRKKSDLVFAFLKKFSSTLLLLKPDHDHVDSNPSLHHHSSFLRKHQRCGFPF